MNPTDSSPPQRGIGITVKIAFACTLLGGLATLATAMTCSFLAHQNLQTVAAERLDATRSLVASRIRALQDDYESRSRDLAQSSLIRRALTDLQADPSSVNGQNLLRAAHQLGNPDGLYLIDSSGQILANEGGSVTAEAWASGTYPTMDLLREAQSSNDLSGRFWSDPQNEANSSFFYALPVPDTTSFILTEFKADDLVQILQFQGRPRDAGLGQEGEAYLVGEDRVARTPVRSGGGSQMQSEGVQLALARGEKGTSTYLSYANKKVIGAYSGVPAPNGNWGLVVEQPVGEALAAAGSLLPLSFGAAIACVTLIAIAGIIWARIFSRPITALGETMQKVSAGDDEARAPVLSSDEIGQLADSFNRLVEERNTARDRVTTDSRRLQNNIQELLLVVADASEGKLSVHARKTEGILGNVADALNRMLQNVGVLIGEAKNASSQVEHAAAEISAYAEALTLGAAQQSEQVNRTIQDVETMTVEAQNVSENSKEAAHSATRTREAAEKGASAVKETIQFMESLQENVQATSNKINELGQRSQEISGIVQSISEISAETDVLAMNASIEAARAGEQGKGFTIVADQVRALADRTRLATVEIEKLVRGIQSETSEAVRQMDSQNQEVRNGVRQVTRAGDELSNIVETSVDSSTLAEQISTSSTEQENRAQAVLQAIVSINQVAEETRSRTVEFQQTSEQLAMLANELNKQLANFEIEDSLPERTDYPETEPAELEP